MFRRHDDTTPDQSRRARGREDADRAAAAAAVLRAQRRLAQVGAATGDIPVARQEPATEPLLLPRR